MVKKHLRNKILKQYYNLNFPGSFAGIKPFQKSLKENLKIEISHEALRRLLKTSLHYQTNFIKPKKFKTRHLYSQGTGIECYCDTVFVPLKEKEGNQSRRFIFLLCVDNHSRYAYTTKLEEVTVDNLKKAFSRILKVSHKWSIIRVDRDPTINALKSKYFAKKGILLLSRRSVNHMGYFEGIVRTLKRKFIQNIRKNEKGRKWSQKRLEKALKDVTYSYNHTVNSHGFKPAVCNDSRFDPELRLRNYGPKAKPKRFEDFYTEQLKLRKKMNTPDTSKKPNFSENPNSYKVEDLVYVDYESKDVGRKAYNVRRGKIYKVAYVNTFASPFLYRLKDVKSRKPLPGWFYGAELSRADLS